jgi:hypothetical protein
MIENQIGMLVIVILILYFLFTKLKKIWLNIEKKEKITDHYKSALSFLFHNQSLLFVILVMVVVGFLVGLPTWLKYQQHAQAVAQGKLDTNDLLSIFTSPLGLNAGNPYQVLSPLYPSKWGYVFSDFFSQIVNTSVGAVIVRIIGITSLSLVILFFSSIICVSLIQSVFLLWLKDQVIETKKQSLSLLKRAQCIFPQFIVFHIVTVLVFIFLQWLHIRTVDFFVLLSTTSGDEISRILVQLAVSILICFIHWIFLVVPILLADREEKNIAVAFTNVKNFFIQHSLKYLLFILIFFCITSVVITLHFVQGVVVPADLLKVIAPWTYIGLGFEFLESILVLFGLGWFTVALIKFVHHSR